jgi:hypothetical protein
MGGTSGGGQNDFYYMGQKKNPSTAAGTYMQGFNGNDFGVKSGPGFGTGIKGGYPGESFDLDIMMPPDIASIDSDISKWHYLILNINNLFKFISDKLSAMTPVPMQGGNFGAPNWGGAGHVDSYPSEFSGVKGHHYSNPSGAGYNMGGGGMGSNYNPNNFEMEFETKYSPSRGGGYHNNNRELASQ